MTTRIEEILAAFDALSAAEQQEAADAIQMRISALSADALSDEELTAIAEEAFLELDRQEARDGNG